MTRKNNRDPRYAARPLDLTPEDFPSPRSSHVLKPGESVHQNRTNREVEAAERQRKARIRKGIDWTVCLVPACGEELKSYGRFHFHDPQWRDPEKVLPLCATHAMTVWKAIQVSRHDSLIIETNETSLQRAKARKAAEDEAAKRKRAERIDGHIYFVRLNGLVKVGWSRSVYDRLRAYGPLVKVLCIYPATRDDETTLHRQLRTVLVRGREWYEDGQIIAAFVAEAIEKHGPPVVYDEWTKPKEVIKLRRR